MSEVAEATPEAGSLAEAAHAFKGLLSVEEKEKPAKQPEPGQREAAADPKLAPAAPSTEESEQAASASSEKTDESSDPPPAPKVWKVKADDAEIEVTEDELLKGYSRHADYTRKTQALADDRRKWEEAEVAAARTVRAQQKAALEEFQTVITSLRPVEPNWDELRKTLGPDAFAAELMGWKKHTESLSAIETRRAELAAEEKADAEKGFAAYCADQEQKLALELPEMKDPEKGPKLRQSLSAFAKSRGFTDDDLNGVSDHRVVLLLHDAFQHHETQKKATTERAKIENKIEQGLQAATPGSRTEQPSSKAKQLQTDKNRLRESGRLEDAAKVFTHLI